MTVDSESVRLILMPSRTAHQAHHDRFDRIDARYAREARDCAERSCIALGLEYCECGAEIAPSPTPHAADCGACTECVELAAGEFCSTECERVAGKAESEAEQARLYPTASAYRNGGGQ